MKIKYNWDYDKYVTDDGKVLRYDSKQGKLLFCGYLGDNGYILVNVHKPKKTLISAHRLVYETFNGKIPQDKEIDHINTIRTDNRLENLRLVTHQENMCNPLTREKYKGFTHSEETKRKMSEARKGKAPSTKGKTFSEFGKKFKEHFGITNYENSKLYHREQIWYATHNKTCRWEMNTDERN